MSTQPRPPGINDPSKFAFEWCRIDPLASKLCSDDLFINMLLLKAYCFSLLFFFGLLHRWPNQTTG